MHSTKGEEKKINNALPDIYQSLWPGILLQSLIILHFMQMVSGVVLLLKGARKSLHSPGVFLFSF